MSNLLEYLKNDPEALRALRADAAAVGRAPIDLAKAFMSLQGKGAKLGSEALANLAGVLGEPVAPASPASQPSNLEPTENMKKQEGYQFLKALEELDSKPSRSSSSSSSSSLEERKAKRKQFKDKLQEIRERKAFNKMSDEEMGGFDPVDFEREGLYGTSDVVEFSDDVGVAREAEAQKQREIDAKIDEKFRGAAYGSTEPSSEGGEKPEARDMAASAEAMPVDEEPAAPAAPKAEPKTKVMSPAATAATEAALGAVEEATAEPEVDYTDQAVDLFKNTHGTEFDPNSKMDREKLEKMKGMLAKQGGLGDMSANQFALQVYRNS